MSNLPRAVVSRLAGAGAAVLLLAASACGAPPADPSGTLDRVRGGELRIGVSHSPPHTDVTGPQPQGPEAELVREFADRLGARIAWTEAGEEALTEQMRQGRLDLIIGGLSEKSPWTDRVALTKPYTEVTGADGTERALVLAAPLGENAFLVELETFLAERKDGQ